MDGEMGQGERRRWLVGAVVVLGLANVGTDRTEGVLGSILFVVDGLAGMVVAGLVRELYVHGRGRDEVVARARRADRALMLVGAAAMVLISTFLAWAFLYPDASGCSDCDGGGARAFAAVVLVLGWGLAGFSLHRRATYDHRQA